MLSAGVLVDLRLRCNCEYSLFMNVVARLSSAQPYGNWVYVTSVNKNNKLINELVTECQVDSGFDR
jgi:hypothetical protein